MAKFCIVGNVNWTTSSKRNIAMYGKEEFFDRLKLLWQGATPLTAELEAETEQAGCVPRTGVT